MREPVSVDPGERGLLRSAMHILIGGMASCHGGPGRL